LADSLFFKTARNMKEVSKYIACHKYRRGAWNLPHKFHLYLIRCKNLRLILSNN
jgi:hypothetical protein